MFGLALFERADDINKERSTSVWVNNVKWSFSAFPNRLLRSALMQCKTNATTTTTIHKIKTFLAISWRQRCPKWIKTFNAVSTSTVCCILLALALCRYVTFFVSLRGLVFLFVYINKSLHVIFWKLRRCNMEQRLCLRIHCLLCKGKTNTLHEHRS